MNGPTVSHRILFERLCLYREIYARRGPQDRSDGTTIAEVIRQASAALVARPALIEIG